MLQNALGEAVRQEKTQEKDQGVVALAKKAQDLYKQQQEIIKRVDKKYVMQNMHVMLCYCLHCGLEQLFRSSAHQPVMFV